MQDYDYSFWGSSRFYIPFIERRKVALSVNQSHISSSWSASRLFCLWLENSTLLLSGKSKVPRNNMKLICPLSHKHTQFS